MHELKHDPDAHNYLYTDRPVTLHWDGAFAAEVPHWRVFRCVQAPVSEGESTFVDTGRVLDQANPEQRTRWEATTVQSSTQKKARYGGTFTPAVVDTHTTDGDAVLRYAEPVDHLNPVDASPSGPDAERLHDLLRDVLYGPDVLLAYALRRGRHGYDPSGPRRLHR